MKQHQLRHFAIVLISTVCLLGTITSQATSLHPIRGSNGIVSSSSRIASEVGIDILRQGGNAVDAAIATAFAMAVTWPTAGNIGGGGFLVYHGADGEDLQAVVQGEVDGSQPGQPLAEENTEPLLDEFHGTGGGHPAPTHGHQVGDEVIQRAADTCVHGMITVSVTSTYCEASLLVAERYDNVWCTAGVHPLYADQPRDWSRVRAVAEHPKCVAWGELGLDNHYDKPPRPIQDATLAEHLALIETAADVEQTLVFF